MIYRLPCRAALSVRKSLRAVRIAERNRYIENTPLGTPSGTAGEWKRLFFWLQKSGVNCEKCKRYNLSPIQPLSLFAPSEQKSSSPYTGEPRNAPQTLCGNPVQGKQEMQCKRFPRSGIQPLSHGVSIPKPPCQLPLHSWLSSAASGGYNEKGKLLPSASARANSRSTSG